MDSGRASSPPSSVLWASKTPPRPSRQSSVSLDYAVPPLPAETRRSPTFVGNPSESVPRARHSGGSTRPLRHGSRDAAFRRLNDVGIRNESRFRSCIRAARSLAIYASPRQSPGAGARLATGLPATALTGLDLHQLDSTQRFHVLIDVPPLLRFRGAMRRSLASLAGQDVT